MSSNKIKQRKYISGLSRYFFKIPSVKKIILISLIPGILTGIIGYSLIQGIGSPLNTVLYGSMMSLFFLWVPMLLSGFLTSLISTWTPRKLTLRRSMYLSFFSASVLSLFYVMGSIVPYSSILNFVNLLIYGYVFIFVLRLLVIKVTHPYTNIEAFGLGLIQPLLGYLFIYLSVYVTFLVTPVNLSIPFSSLVLKAGLSLTVLTGGVLLFFHILNAPMKRNFGVSTFRLSRAVLGYWLDGSTEVENVFTEMGENIDTQAGVVLFKKRGDGLKSIFIVPYLHPGPFEGIGGGRLTEIFTENLEKEFGATLFLPHSASTHDLNPVDVESVYSAAEQINKGISSSLNKSEFSSTGSTSVTVGYENAKMMGQVLGNAAVTMSTFSPKETDDIDTSLGLAIENTLKTSFPEAIHIDAHNRYSWEHTPITSGDTRAYDLLEASEKIKEELEKQEIGELKQGIATSQKLVREEGEIGPTGIRVSVIEVNDQKTAYVVVGANNVIEGLREKVIKEVKKLGVDEVELMTTDTHSVNKLSGGEIPLGKVTPEEEIIKNITNTAEEALKDMEPVEIAADKINISGVNVLGRQMEPELVSTINSTIAVTKIVGPLVFGSSLLLSLIAVTI